MENYSSNPDIDNDGVSIDNDNCPNDYNPDQIDSDGDQIGDECDDCNDLLGDLDDNQIHDILDIVRLVNLNRWRIKLRRIYRL